MPSRQSRLPFSPSSMRAARDVADVGLVVGVAADDLEVVAAAHEPDRQHALRVQQLARHVDRHVADRQAAGARSSTRAPRPAGSPGRAPRRAPRGPGRSCSRSQLNGSSTPAGASRGTPGGPRRHRRVAISSSQVETLETREVRLRAARRERKPQRRAPRSAGSRPSAAGGALAPRPSAASLGIVGDVVHQAQAQRLLRAERSVR